MQNEKINIAKAIGIILMVIGHSGCPNLLHDLIYQFHMPLFFFLSGWTFKDKYINNIKSFFITRTKRLYGTFIIYGFLFLSLHNILAFLNFYNTPNSYDNVNIIYGKKDFISEAFKILAFKGVDQLLGGYWFLKVLFVSSLIFLLSLYFTRKSAIKETMSKIKLFIFPIYLATTSLLAFGGFETKYMIATTFISAGSIAHEYKFELYKKKLLLIISSLFLFVSAIYYPMSMLEITKPHLSLFFTLTSFAGIYISMIISQYAIKWRIKDLLVYIGKNTLSILTFHMISFKLVSLLKIWHLKFPYSYLGDFPVIFEKNGFYWVLYSLVGIFAPLFLSFLGKKIYLTNINIIYKK